jgi:Pectate lyase superfamily protein
MENEVFYNRDKMYENIPNQEKRLLKDVEALKKKGASSVDWLNAVELGVDNTGSRSVGDAINKVIRENDFRTIYFPDGTYNIDKEILLNNYCNLKLGANATFKCVATLDNMIHINRTAEKTKQFISGGVLDGNGKANHCIYSTYAANFQIFETIIKNALVKNVYLYKGYEFYLTDIQIDNSLTYTVNPNLAGIHASCTDSVFTNIVVKNNTVGIINDSVSNEFYSIHVWGNKVDRLANSKGLVANGETRMYNFYSDTCAVGVEILNSSEVFLHNSKFIFGENYLSQLGITPLFIKNDTGTVHLYNCRLSSYETKVDIGSSMTRVYLYNCTFSAPFNTNSAYTNIKNYNQEFYRITLSDFAVGANSYKRVQIPITGIIYQDFYTINIINDSSQFTNWKSYLSDGALNIIFFNTSASSVTLSGLKVNLTRVSNTNLPIKTSNFTVT